MRIVTANINLYKNININEKDLFFLSDFCFQNINLINQNKKKISEDIWIDFKKKNKDLIFLQDLYEELIIIFTDELNRLHNKNESRRYWEIIIGFWLHEFIGLSFIYYSQLKKCLNQFDIKYHYGPSLIGEKHKILDYDHFSNLFQNEIFCYNFTSKILKYLKPNVKFLNEEINLNEFKDKYFCKRNNVKNFFLKKCRNILNFFFSYIFNVTFYIDTSKLSMLQKINLTLSFKSIPTPNIGWPIDFIVKNKLKKNISFERFTFNDEFKNFFFTIVPEYIPLSYTDNFNFYNKKSCNRGRNCKYIYSSSSFNTNDYFKIWAANKISKGSKYIISDHGDSFKRDFYSPDNVIKNISDLTLQYNNSVYKKNYFFNPNIQKKNKRNYTRKKGCISIITLDNSWRPRRAISDLQSSNIFKSVDQIFKLSTNLLSNEIYNFKLKNYKNRGLNTFEFYKKNFPLNVTKVPMKKLFNESSLVICSYPSTSFIESLYYDIPTIFLYPKNSYFYDKSFDLLEKKMIEEELIFNSDEKCLNFLIKYNNNFSYWWDKVVTKELKNLLYKRFLNSNSINNLCNKIKNLN